MGMRNCLKCGANTDLEPITVTIGSEIRVLILCPDDAAPLRALFDIGLTGPPGDTDDDSAPEPKARGHQFIPID